MNILHIANYAVGSSVYNDLFLSLDNTEIIDKQLVLCAAKSGTSLNAKNTSGVNYYFFSKVPRFLNPFIISKAIFKFLVFFRNNEVRNFSKNASLVHAHTLFSDGVIGLFFSLVFKKRLVVTVRNSDLFFYLKYFPFAKIIGRVVLNNADSIVFPSLAMQYNFERLYGFLFHKKSFVITNGVDPIYHWKKSVSCKSLVRVVFVGNSSQNKNLVGLLEALDFLALKKPELTFQIDIFGIDSTLLSENATLSPKAHPDINIKAHGVVTKDRLLNEYCSGGILVVPSFRETFGLVFLEALACGMPVVYSREQGVDGLVKEEHGCRCDPNSKESIASAILNASQICLDSCASAYYRDHFSWSSIALDYCTKLLCEDQRK